MVWVSRWQSTPAMTPVVVSVMLEVPFLEREGGRRAGTDVHHSDGASVGAGSYQVTFDPGPAAG